MDITTKIINYFLEVIDDAAKGHGEIPPKVQVAPLAASITDTAYIYARVTMFRNGHGVFRVVFFADTRKLPTSSELICFGRTTVKEFKELEEELEMAEAEYRRKKFLKISRKKAGHERFSRTGSSRS